MFPFRSRFQIVLLRSHFQIPDKKYNRQKIIDPYNGLYSLSSIWTGKNVHSRRKTFTSIHAHACICPFKMRGHVYTHLYKTENRTVMTIIASYNRLPRRRILFPFFFPHAAPAQLLSRTGSERWRYARFTSLTMVRLSLLLNITRLFQVKRCATKS